MLYEVITKKRIAGEAIGAMQAGAGGLAGCIEPRNGGSRMQVRDNSAAGVVCRRNDRDWITGDVDTQFQATRHDVGEVLLKKLGGFVGNRNNFV